ncbi:MAG: hypothetical protein HGA51_11195 [Demequinaceae bacterium]|nr:hypothetical protein [Demequinaceae bacterium]
MTKRFQLAGLMRVRELQEEKAAADLAEANEVKLEAKRRSEAANETLGKQSFPDLARANAYDAHAEALTSYSPNWQAIVAARAAVAAMLRESNQALAVASENAAMATEQWARAKTQAAMIDKLKVRHDVQLEAEALREEQLTLDEAALRKAVEEKS